MESSLLKKFNLNLDHLSYEYVDKCSNKKDLERIVRVLRSGEEGFFPDLLQRAEDRLKDIAPTSICLQSPKPLVREKDIPGDEWDALQTDLAEWERDIKKQDPFLKEIAKPYESALPAVRTIKGAQDAEKPTSVRRSDERSKIKCDDYSRWDQFDVDEELTRLDVEEERKEEEKKKLRLQEEKKEKNLINSKLNVKDILPADDLSEESRRILAEKAKEKGNEYFKAGDYQLALAFYNESIAYKPSCLTFNNRAMTFIKMGKEKAAIADCSYVLSQEPTNVKALYRRAKCYRNSVDESDWRRALHDLETILALEPHNKVAESDYRCIRSKLNYPENPAKVRLKIEEAPQEPLPVLYYGPSTSVFRCDPTSVIHLMLTGSRSPTNRIPCICNGAAQRVNPLCRFCGERTIFELKRKASVKSRFVDPSMCATEVVRICRLRNTNFYILPPKIRKVDPVIPRSGIGLKRPMPRDDLRPPKSKYCESAVQNVDLSGGEFQLNIGRNTGLAQPLAQTGSGLQLTCGSSNNVVQNVDVSVDNLQSSFGASNGLVQRLGQTGGEFLHSLPNVDRSGADLELSTGSSSDFAQPAGQTVGPVPGLSPRLADRPLVQSGPARANNLATNKINAAPLVNVSKERLLASQAKERGDGCQKAGDFSTALAYYSTSIKLYPDTAALLGRAVTHIKLGRYSEAVSDCSRVLELDPNNSQALLRRATAYSAMPDNKYWKLGLEDLERVVSSRPGDKIVQGDVNALMETLLGCKRRSRFLSLKDPNMGGSVGDAKGREVAERSRNIVREPRLPPPSDENPHDKSYPITGETENHVGNGDAVTEAKKRNRNRNKKKKKIVASADHPEQDGSGVKQLTASVRALQLSPEARCPPTVALEINSKEVTSHKSAGSNASESQLLMSPNKKATKMHTELTNSHIKNSANIQPGNVDNAYKVGANETIKLLSSPTRGGVKSDLPLAQPRPNQLSATMASPLKNGQKVAENILSRAREKMEITKESSHGEGGPKILSAANDGVTNSVANPSKLASPKAKSVGSPTRSLSNPSESASLSNPRPLLTNPAQTETKSSETLERSSCVDVITGENQCGEGSDTPEKEAAATDDLPSSFQFYSRWESKKKKDSDFSERISILQSVPPSRLQAVIGEKLDADMLSELVQCLELLAPRDPTATGDYLHCLSTLPRFGLVKLLLDSSDLQRTKRLIESLESCDVLLESDLKSALL